MSKKLVKSEEYSHVFNTMIELSDETGISISSLLDKYCSSRSAMNAWKKGNINADILSKIADEFNCGLDKLLRTPQNLKNIAKKLSTGLVSDEEQILLDNYRKSTEIDKARIQERAQTCAEHAEMDKTPKSFKVPILSLSTIKLFDSSVSAGTGIDIDYSTHTEITTSEDIEGADFAVRVSGDSMVPRFHNRDIVLVESTPSVEVGEIGIFILNGQAYIKELGENKLISLNKKYAPIEITENDSIYCQGKVIKILTAVQEV